MIVNKLAVAVLVFCFALSSLWATSSTILSNFNNTPISAGNYIWFNAQINLTGGPPPVPINIYAVSGTVSFTANSQLYTLAVPSAVVSFSPTPVTPSTTFSGGQWQSVDNSGASRTFLVGFGYQVPAGGLPGGISPVNFTMNFFTDTPGVQFNWRWSAAVYTAFDLSNYNNLGIKTTTTGGLQAGTPVNYQSYLVAGGKGNGGTNYTGSFSSNNQVTPALATPEPSMWLIMASMLVFVFLVGLYRQRAYSAV